MHATLCLGKEKKQVDEGLVFAYRMCGDCRMRLVPCTTCMPPLERKGKSSVTVFFTDVTIHGLVSNLIMSFPILTKRRWGISLNVSANLIVKMGIVAKCRMEKMYV